MTLYGNAIPLSCVAFNSNDREIARVLLYILSV